MANTEKADTMLMEHADIGSVRIAADVLSRIAGIAALDVEGVTAVASNLNREAVSRVSRSTLAKGVKVTTEGGKAACVLSLVLAYGHHIPDVCRRVQNKVAATLTNMTGLAVSDVDVRVSGISMQEEV